MNKNKAITTKENETLNVQNKTIIKRKQSVPSNRLKRRIKWSLTWKLISITRHGVLQSLGVNVVKSQSQHKVSVKLQPVKQGKKKKQNIEHLKFLRESSILDKNHVIFIGHNFLRKKQVLLVLVFFLLESIDNISSFN